MIRTTRKLNKISTAHGLGETTDVDRVGGMAAAPRTLAAAEVRSHDVTAPKITPTRAERFFQWCSVALLS